MLRETIKDVHRKDLQAVVENFQSEGFTTSIIPQSNGLYTVTATKPNRSGLELK